MNILGLDISTSVIGLSIIDTNIKDGKCIYSEHIDLKKIDRVILISQKKHENNFNGFLRPFGFQKVFIEDALMKFTSNQSSAFTIASLLRFNGMVSGMIYLNFCSDIEYLAAVSARKEIGIKRQKGKKGKELVFEYMKENEKWFPIVYKKTQKPKDWIFDRMDAWVVCRAGFLRIQKSALLDVSAKIV